MKSARVRRGHTRLRGTVRAPSCADEQRGMGGVPPVGVVPPTSSSLLRAALGSLAFKGDDTTVEVLPSRDDLHRLGARAFPLVAAVVSTGHPGRGIQSPQRAIGGLTTDCLAPSPHHA